METRTNCSPYSGFSLVPLHWQRHGNRFTRRSNEEQWRFLCSLQRFADLFNLIDGNQSCGPETGCCPDLDVMSGFGCVVTIRVCCQDPGVLSGSGCVVRIKMCCPGPSVLSGSGCVVRIKMCCPGPSVLSGSGCVVRIRVSCPDQGVLSGFACVVHVRVCCQVPGMLSGYGCVVRIRVCCPDPDLLSGFGYVVCIQMCCLDPVWKARLKIFLNSNFFSISSNNIISHVLAFKKKVKIEFYQVRSVG